MSIRQRASFFLKVATLFLLLLGLSALPAMASDTQPPVLTGFTFSPMSIDTSNSSATVTGTATATDNLSGVYYVDMEFISPSGHQVVGRTLSLISGTILNGTWQGTATFPIYSEAGTWTVQDVSVVDNVGNSKFYYTADLQALGFPTTLQVTSQQDMQAPMLTGFTFSPMSIDTSNSSATVTGTATATDNLSGVYYVDMEFISPSGHQVVGRTLSLISGTILNGTWQGTATFPIYSEAGTWTVQDVSVVDNVGNSKFYYTADLQALGFPTTLQVISGTSVTLTSSVNPSALKQPVTFTATVASNNGIVPTGTLTFNDGNKTLGTSTLDLTGTATFTIATLSPGTHSIVASYSGDSNYDPGDSSPLSQGVGKAPSRTTVVSSRNPSRFGAPVTFTATVESTVGTPLDGETVIFTDNGRSLGSASLVSGIASLTTTKLTAGAHRIEARYSGDPRRQESTSPPLGQLVMQP